MKLCLTAVAALLTAGLLFPSVSKSQSFIADDNDVSIFIDDIWEHKVTLSIAWKVKEPCKLVSRSESVGTMIWGNANCPLYRRNFGQHHLSETSLLRADEEAHIACGYYKRNAVGPINVSRSGGTANIFQYTYACSIR